MLDLHVFAAPDLNVRDCIFFLMPDKKKGFAQVFNNCEMNIENKAFFV